MKRDLLSFADLDITDIEAIALRAVRLSEHWQQRSMPQTLAGTRIGLIEELPGWRNPCALALGATTMGAACVPVGARLEGAETVEDLAGYMGNWFDLVGIRTPKLDRLRSFAGASTAAVVNLRTNDNHPCEILGDLSFILHERGSWNNLRVAMVGPDGNIARSWLEAADVLPIEVTQITLPEFAFPAGALPPRVSVTGDVGAILEADLIVTDCWPVDVSEDERERFSALGINAALLDRCSPEILFVPCPPVTRGEEVAADAMYHHRCMAKAAKAFLLHAQNAVMEWCLDR